MKLIGIIPAREGSKGILKKNLQKIGEKTLLEWAIEVAIESKIFDKIVVDTDSDEMIAIAKLYSPIEVPFKRPVALSGDHVHTRDVVLHLIQWLKTHQHYFPDVLMLLEPTCPFRTALDIRNAYRVFCEQYASSLVSVSEPFQHPCDLIYEDNHHEYHYCLARKENSRGRGDYGKAWFINGAIFMTRADHFLKTKQFYDLSSSILYKMQAHTGIDIDTPFDLAIARAYYEFLWKQ